MVVPRGRESARPLWAKIPVVYREQATLHTAQDDASPGVMPAEQHKAMTTHARKTHHLERFNHTWRPGLSRLTRGPLSFSHQRAQHSGAIKYYICHHNLTRAAALRV